MMSMATRNIVAAVIGALVCGAVVVVLLMFAGVEGRIIAPVAAGIAGAVAAAVVIQAKQRS